MRFKKNIEIEKGKIDITPLIDVVLLLLIFFMLTSTFIVQPVIPVKLPKAVTGKSLQAKRIEIFVTSEDIIYFYGTPVTMLELKQKLSKLSADNTGVLIQSDKEASLGKVVQIWDVCRELNILQIDLATTSGR
jgi:biopolymer transport protein ExbD